MTCEEYENLKVGDNVYKITDVGILELKIIQKDEYDPYLSDGSKFYVHQKSKTYFCSKEEAENQIKLNMKNKIKKQKMYEYETQLNKELNLNTYLIKY